MRLIVKLKEKPDDKILNEIRKICTITHVISISNYLGADVEKNKVDILKSLEFVEHVKEPGKAKAMIVSAANDTGATALLEKGIYGEGIIISVIDSGVDMLDPAVAYSVRSAEDFTGEGMYDLLGHGRIVSRIMRTLSPGCSLLNAKVLNRDNQADELDIMQAIDWSVRTHASHIINISLGIDRICDGSCPVCETAEAASKSSIVVAAAGNNGPGLNTITCPGNAVGAVTVGAADNGRIATFSSRGSKTNNKPTIVAPGIIEMSGLNMRGTSVAAPIVSSCMALLLSKFGSNSGCVDAIDKTCKDLGCHKYEQGFGKIQANKAYALLAR